MAEGKRGSPHGEGSYGMPTQRDLLGGVEVPSGRRSSRRVSRGRDAEPSFFLHPPAPTVPPEPVTQQQDTTPIIRGGADYFRGRELPTDVCAPTGVSYYKRLEDIPTKSFRNRTDPLKVDSIEERAAMALQVCPPMEGEPADASFQFVGERGLYVRVIVREIEETVGGVTRKKPVIRWMHYNEETTDLKHIRVL